MHSSSAPAKPSSKSDASMMEVLMISPSYPADLGDWRGLFIRYLAEALARHEEIRLRLWSPPGEIPGNAQHIATPQENRWLAWLMAQGGIAHIIRHGGMRGLMSPLRLLQMLAVVYRRHSSMDIYHINWLQCALPLPRNGKPVLIAVLGNDMKLLRLPLMKSLLRRTMRDRKVAICPNADWMQAPLMDAFGDLAEVQAVSFGIDPSWYHIQRDLPLDRRIWLAVTRLTLDKLGPLFEWSESLFRDGMRELHLFGPMQENINIPDWIHYHGSATPEQLANTWFPNAQGLITLSRHAEGRPQVMLEAMAAGLPIIASRTLAHGSMVEEGVTGRMCDSLEDYTDALRQLDESAINLRFGENARAWAAREIGTWDDCANRYTQIYRRLLGRAEDG